VELEEGGTLPRVWAAHWAAHPGWVTLIDAGTTMGGGELAQRTAAAAAALAQLGVSAGNRVVWSCSTSSRSVVALLGAMRLGAVVVPVSPAMTSTELMFVVDDVRPAAVLVDRTGAVQDGLPEGRDFPVLAVEEIGSSSEHLPAPLLDASLPADDALIVYTSGTTGQPKGAVHTHRSLLAGVTSLRLAWGWTPEDRLILALPLFHVHGLCAGLFGTLAAGSTAILCERFTPDAVADAAVIGTMFFGVPTMYHRLVESGRAGELSSLRLCVSGSAPLASELWERLRSEAGVWVLERYGMSETLLTLSNPLEGERRPGSVGLPLPGVEATVADQDADGVGELMVRGPSLCRGYWERPDASESMMRGEWFATGDLASVADDGYYSIRGRLTELIITGGHNVYPAEVEAVLGRHPSVGEVAVVGRPSVEWGESVIAFVAGRDGAPDVAGIVELAERELAPYKRPREINVVDALPRNAMGKVVRKDLQ
jgi:malonyl-CoA/methylmalonyl-CoA synthetase